MQRLIHLLAHPRHLPEIYVDKECRSIDFEADRLGRPVSDLKKADVIITCNTDHLLHEDPSLSSEENKTVITLSYRDFIRHKNITAGSFFWQKGRPNIIINENYLKKHKIRIPESYEKFVE
ncbi:hypothetical protein [Hydrogenimonas sp. SS33]|uniref:hypothetical protein n=1 Tax=Hydrogenimonas leucolamina TaxID=2954236 RepID=UPI00336BCF47